MSAARLVAVWVLASACSSAREQSAGGSAPTHTQPSTNQRDDGAPEETACDHIVVAIDENGLWIGAPPELRCLAPRKDGAIDLAWLASELRTLKGALDPSCVPLVEILGYPAANPELGDVNDVVVKVGLTTRALHFHGAGPSNLVALVNNLEPSSTPARCPTPRRAGPTHPIVTITDTAISVTSRGRTVPVARLADVAQTTDTLPALAAALGTPTHDRTFVLQADEDTHVTIINRVVVTARQSGFARMVFAVRKRGQM